MKEKLFIDKIIIKPNEDIMKKILLELLISIIDIFPFILRY